MGWTCAWIYSRCLILYNIIKTLILYRNVYRAARNTYIIMLYIYKCVYSGTMRTKNDREPERRELYAWSRVVVVARVYHISVWKVEQRTKCATEVTDFSGLNADTTIINNNNIITAIIINNIWHCISVVSPLPPPPPPPSSGTYSHHHHCQTNGCEKS